MTHDNQPVKKKLKIKKAEAKSSIEETLKTQLDQYLSEYKKYRSLSNQYEAQAKLAQINAIERMTSLELEKTNFSDEDGLDFDVKIIRPDRVHIDETRLRNHLDDALWEKITKTVVDKSAIDRAVKDDLININVLTECISIIPAQPYIKITNSKKEDGDGEDN